MSTSPLERHVTQFAISSAFDVRVRCRRVLRGVWCVSEMQVVLRGVWCASSAATGVQARYRCDLRGAWCADSEQCTSVAVFRGVYYSGLYGAQVLGAHLGCSQREMVLQLVFSGCQRRHASPRPWNSVSASTGVAREHERPPSPALVPQKPCPTPLSRHPEVHSTMPKLSSGPSHTMQIARDCHQGPSCAFSRIDRGRSTEFTDFQNVRMRLVALQMRARMLGRPLRAKMGCVRFCLRAGRRD